MRKPSSRPIYDDNIRFTYFFDRDGNLIGFRKTYPALGGRIDTTSYSRIVVGGELLQESEQIGRYQRRITYQRIDSATVKRTIKVKRGSMDWEDFSKEKIVKKSIANGYVEMIGGLRDEPYQRVVYEHDKSGRLTQIETWNGSRMQSVETWTYKDSSLKKYEFKDLLDNQKSSYSFPMNWEEDIGLYCDEDQCKDWSIVTHENGWPKGWIFMNPTTQDMNIWEFDYKYW